VTLDGSIISYAAAGTGAPTEMLSWRSPSDWRKRLLPTSAGGGPLRSEFGGGTTRL